MEIVSKAAIKLKILKGWKINIKEEQNKARKISLH